MVKFAIVLFLTSICLSLQLVTASQNQENNGNKINESNEIKSNAISSRSLFLIVVRTTIGVIDKFANTLIQEKGQFIADLLTELNALTEKTSYIQELIPELSSILKQREKLDLSQPGCYEKAAVLEEILKTFADFERIRQSGDNSSDTVMLNEIFKKLDLEGLHARIEESAKEEVQDFTAAYERFWNSLSDTEREKYTDLKEWYKSFQAMVFYQEKLQLFYDFIIMLRSIALKI